MTVERAARLEPCPRRGCRQLIVPADLWDGPAQLVSWRAPELEGEPRRETCEEKRARRARVAIRRLRRQALNPFRG